MRSSITRAGRWEAAWLLVLSLAACGGGDHGNDLADASPVEAGDVEFGSLPDAQDVDVLAIELPVGFHHRIFVRATDRIRGELLDADGNVLQAGESDLHTLDRFARKDGRVFVRLGGARVATNWTAWSEQYQADDHGSSASDATPLAPGAPAAGAVSIIDGDVFAFRGTAGHFYEARAGENVVLKLLLPDGGAGPTRVGTLAFRFTGPVPVFIVVGPKDNGHEPVAYTLTVQELGVDDFGDTAAEAQRIVPGQEVRGRTEIDTDVDAFSFELVEGHSYGLVELEGAPRPAIFLDAGRVSAPLPILGTSSRPFVFFARLSRPGPWAFRLVDHGPDLHGNVPAEAAALDLPDAEVHGRLDDSVDVDVFRFDAVEGHIFAISTTSIAVRILDASGVPLPGEPAWGPPRRVWTVPATGTYFIAVDSPHGGVTDYVLRVVDTGPDDHADTAANATRIVPDTPATGILQTEDDVDTFTFTATEGLFYRVTCTRPDRGGTNFRIHDAQGFFGSASRGNDGAFKARSNGPVTITVYEAFEPPQAYTVLVESRGADDFADGEAGATALAYDTPVSGVFEIPGDVDSFRFRPRTGRIARVTCTPATAGAFCPVSVFAGTRVVRARGSPVEVWEADSDDELLVAVGNIGSPATGWTVLVTDAGVDDAGDSTATASTGQLGAETRGHLETPEDVDVYAFTLEAARRYVVSPLESAVRYGTSVVGPDGRTLALQGRWAAPSVFTTTAEGTYFVVLTASSQPAPYAFTLDPE